MDLKLDIVGRGRGAEPTMAVILGEVLETDLALRAAQPALATSETPALKRLSQRHHALARVIASGVPIGEAALQVGYAPSSASILQSDPAFKELVAFYAQQVQEVYVGLHEKMAGVALDAMDIIAERMETEPEKIGTLALLEIAKTTADRTGHGPSTTNTQVNINIGMADRVKAARVKAMEAATARQIEGVARAVIDGE